MCRAFYRYHVKDPIYFQTDIRVTIQRMFGATIEQYLKHIKRETCSPRLPNSSRMR